MNIKGLGRELSAYKVEGRANSLNKSFGTNLSKRNLRKVFGLGMEK